ncbi:uncharacterized protein LOC132550877 [Ylistrum balloti]|uniref:uncharacterized protein LOC132550877 n=1 Tax=Ylistrum balloti TaxID=509963 RepID=UPI002905D09B|nr:uncharacterized protein LOC132550877 [Ylistrum balloti]
MATDDSDVSSSWNRCLCQRPNNLKIVSYYNSNNELIGTFCKECRAENLTREYVIHAGYEDKGDFSENTPRSSQGLDEHRAFQVQSSKTRIDLRIFASILKPGDQISWHRQHCFWHHAIVEDVAAETNELKLIHWNKKENNIKILRDSIKVEASEEGLFNKMYRIDYPVEITKTNDPELVLARARSRIDDTGYSPFTDNCESFATYCKTGVEKSHQLAWVEGKIGEILGQNIATFAKSTINATCKILQTTVSVSKTAVEAGRPFQSGGIEHVMLASNVVGAGIIIMLETGFVTWDLSQVYAQRKHGNTSRNDFIETAIRRVVEGVLSAGVTILFSLGPELIGMAVGSPLGPVGIFVGGVIGGIVGGVVGKYIGTALGSVIGKAISSSFKTDDRAVTNICDLKCGDHIVLYRGILHPRCHAIVVEQNGIDKIKVIRNKYKAGVVEEWVSFSKPLFRINYKQGVSKDPEEVVKMARSKLGEYRYCLPVYNCKTFARQCKSNLSTETEDEPWQLINYEDLPAESFQYACDAKFVST